MKLNAKMYDLQGNQVIIEKVDKESIYAVVVRVLEINYNNGNNTERQIVEKQEIFNISDLGIKLFYSKDDIIDHKKLQINDKRYIQNQNNINKHFNHKFDYIAEEIKKDKPIGLILTPMLKEKIIKSYYMSDENIKSEKLFHLNNKGCFGRIDVDTEFYRKYFEMYHREHYYDVVYITKGTYCNYKNIHIVNWRSPIASMYYDNENTRLTRKTYIDIVNETNLDNPLNVYNYELMLKRSYSFNPFNYVNSYIATDELYKEGSADSFLLKILEENRNNHKISDIIKTIQSNQNKIIRHSASNNMIVQGCAGSGKTMILLHRISYLLFNDLLPIPSGVRIITPNDSFAEFIKDLVNSLELNSIERTTMFNYDLSLAKRYQRMFRAIAKRNKDGKIINKEELSCYERSIDYFENNMDFAEEPDNNVEKGFYFSDKFLDGIKMKYNEEVIRLVNDLYAEKLFVIADRMGVNYDNSLPYGSKYYLDNLYNLSYRGILLINETMIDNITNLHETINKNKKHADNLEELLKDFKVIESYIAILIKEMFPVNKSIELLTLTKEKLININKTYTYKNDCINSLNAE